MDETQKTSVPETGEKEKIDYTKYPEGFNAIVAMLDFIPEDRREATMLSLIDNLGRRRPEA